ncbi:MAG TPA: carbonate dehydratase [Burkholderiales bacterium]|nr:carbonate dehydratase [Burkholderiales bacterium]
MKSLEHLFENNRAWVEASTRDDPEFFSRLSNQQNPEYLWIGCSDSRVPANQIIGLAPGEVFVHRNIANMVVHTDLNCLSVIQFAVDIIQVKHIIVVGHYGCSGVHAALTNHKIGLSDNWLRHVQDVQEKHGAYLGNVVETRDRHARLCELNVIEQVRNVCQTTSVQEAWERGQALHIHGWVYGVADGLARDLEMNISSHAEVEAASAGAVARVQGMGAR